MTSFSEGIKKNVRAIAGKRCSEKESTERSNKRYKERREVSCVWSLKCRGQGKGAQGRAGQSVPALATRWHLSPSAALLLFKGTSGWRGEAMCKCSVYLCVVHEASKLSVRNL